MHISVFDLFSIGIGPSSSHTVGPMYAANAFVDALVDADLLNKVGRVKCDLYGSLALTGVGHGTDTAVIIGLESQTPEQVDPASIPPRLQEIFAEKKLRLGGHHVIPFETKEDLLMRQKEVLPKHTNGMRLSAYDQNSNLLFSEIYYSIGGGFIKTDANFEIEEESLSPPPFPFSSARELLALCKEQNMRISDLMLVNEKTWRSMDDIRNGIMQLAETMENCINNGCHHEGILPGGLYVKRRAPELFKLLSQKGGVKSIYEASDMMNRLNMYAMAVNEENAAGGRIVTAPTNGAAGIIPAVMRYYREAHEKMDENDLLDYFLTSAAIGILYKKNASISGAEVGCQGEVGVASSMAAAGITAVLGGTLEQIENAAEIAMEHHLGMTCDPVNGLVQIPCIERNAMGALKAVNASRMALIGDGQHHISLDRVIDTMFRTGKDMNTIYKETSLGGLAVNHPEC